MRDPLISADLSEVKEMRYLVSAWIQKGSLMMALKTTQTAIAAVSLMLFYPQEIHAKGFTNQDFLIMPELQQKGFLDGTIHTLWQVAAQKDADIGQCVYDWYYEGEQAKTNGLIFKSMEQYPNERPTVILMALTERACGRYIRVWTHSGPKGHLGH